MDEDAEGILGLEDSVLISKLQSRELTAVGVLRAYVAKAVGVSEVCSCVTEFHVDVALKRAEQLDGLRSEVRGPLHGVPIAVKDDFDVEGMDTTLGYAKRLYDPKKKDAVLIKGG